MEVVRVLTPPLEGRNYEIYTNLLRPFPHHSSQLYPQVPVKGADQSWNGLASPCIGEAGG